VSPKVISPPSDARLVARAREHFLESGEVGDFASVREAILTSWRRSQFWGVSVEFGELPHQDIDTDTRLVRAAQPVLDRLQLVLSDMAVSVILTDARANILDRRAGDPSLNQELDAVWLAPGFSYARAVRRDERHRRRARGETARPGARKRTLLRSAADAVLRRRPHRQPAQRAH